MHTTRRILTLIALLLLVASVHAAEKLRVVLIDGQNNHNWKACTPVLKEQLLKTGRFAVDVLTSPPKGAAKDAWASFKIDFSKVDVIVSNYNGQSWPKEVNDGLEKDAVLGQPKWTSKAPNRSSTVGWCRHQTQRPASVDERA